MCTSGHKCYSFIDSTNIFRKRKVSVFIYLWMQFSYHWTHYIFPMQSLSYCISILSIFISNHSNIVLNSKVRAPSPPPPERMHFSMIGLITYFWCIHLHTASISFLVLLIQSNIVGNSKARIVIFRLNTIFVWLGSLHIFDALTIILDQTHSLFCEFNWTSLVLSR